MPLGQRADHPLPHLQLPMPERRRREIQNQPMPAQRLRQHGPLPHQLIDRIDGVHLPRPEHLVIPRILADRHRNRLPLHHRQRLLPGRLKVPLLIEHVIERQQHLLLHELHLAVFQQRRHIAHMLARRQPRTASATRTAPPACPARASAPPPPPASAPRAPQTPLFPVNPPEDTHTSPAPETSPAPAPSAAARSTNSAIFLQVPREVSNRWINLRQRDPHPYSLSRSQQSPPRPAPPSRYPLHAALKTPSPPAPRPPSVPGCADPAAGSSSRRTPCPARYSCRTTDPAAPPPATAP